MKTLIAVTLSLGIVPFARTVQAQTAAALIWVDAGGVVVGPFSSDDYYLDDGGFIWHLDSEEGTLRDRGLEPRDFLEPDCAGPAYVRPTPVRSGVSTVRQVFRLFNLPGRWVRSDTERMQNVHVVSTDYGDRCLGSIGFDSLAVPASTLRPAPDDPPLLPFTPPFHIEKR